jgi:hypothetical protein
MVNTTVALLRRTLGVVAVTTLLFVACGAEPDTTQVMLPFRRPRPPTRAAGTRRPIP